MPDRVAGGIVRRIYGNLARLASGKAGAGLISLAYMVIAARALGPADYGVLVLAHGFVTAVGGIVEFPGWHAVVRYGAGSQARGDVQATARLLRFAGLVELSAGAAAVMVSAVLAPIIGPRLGWTATALAFALPYSFALLGSVRSTPAGFLQLQGRFDLLGLHNLVAPLARLIGALAAWSLGTGLPGFLVAWLIAGLLEWVILWAVAIVVARATLGPLPLIGTVRGVRGDNPGIWRFMLIANADITFGELSGRIAPLVIGWWLGPAAVGLYAIAQRATVTIAQPAQILGQAAYAELARLVAGGDRGDRLWRAVVHCVAIAAAAALPVVALLAWFGREIAVLIGGPDFAGAAGVMLWLTLARVAMLAAPPASAALMALGRPSLSVTANLIASLSLLPLLPLLLDRFGPEGAGYHAVVQALAGSAILIACVRVQTGGAPSRGAVA